MHYSREKSISVIIPNYNYGKFIGEAIESVLRQTYPALEIIVIDDGSTDDSVNIIESFGNRVRLIKQKNGGVGKARNIGSHNSKGEFLAFLDADDLWLPEKLAKQILLFKENVGYVSCAMREFNSIGETIGQHIPPENGWKTEDMLLLDKPIVVSGSAFIVSKEIFEKVNGFDENPDLHPSEDWDFARRVSEVSEINSTSEILVDYRFHGRNGHLKIPRFERSMDLAFGKVFDQQSSKFTEMKDQAYGNLHKVLAGSYFQAGNYAQFFKHSFESIKMTPRNAVYFAKFPIRRLKKAIG